MIARLALPDFDNSGPPAIFAEDRLIPVTTRPFAEHRDIRHRAGDYVYSASLDANGFRRTGAVAPDGDGAARLDGRGTLIVGDSFAFGMGVDDDQTVAAWIDRSELAGSCVSPVVNGGWVAGNNPATAAAWIAARPAAFRPSVLLHLVFAANDVEDIVPLDLHRTAGGDIVAVSESAAYVDASGRRRYRDALGLRPVRDWLRSHTRLYYPVYRALALGFPSWFGEQRKPRRTIDEARDVAVASMAQIRRWAAGRNTEYVVAFVPSVEEVRQEAWRAETALLFSASHAAGLEVADLLTGEPALTSAAYFPNDAHWNPDGHATVARQLLARLTEIADRNCRSHLP